LYIFWKSQIDTLEKTLFFVYILNVANLHPCKNIVFCIYFESHELSPLKTHCFLYIFWKSQIDTIEKTLFFVYILNVANWHIGKTIGFRIDFECCALTGLNLFRNQNAASFCLGIKMQHCFVLFRNQNADVLRLRIKMPQGSY